MLLQDLLLGSPPCTDISSANHRAQGIQGAASRYYLEALRLVREMCSYLPGSAAPTTRLSPVRDQRETKASA